MRKKSREVIEELRIMFTGRAHLLDSILPPFVFLIAYTVWGFSPALWASLALAGLFVLFRLLRGHALIYALGGAGGALVAVAVAWLLGRAEGFFLPGIITGLVTVVLCLASVVAGRPLVAWTSRLARRWPLDWYWHPKVRPAYTEVTVAWTIYFTVRLLLQVFLFREAQAEALAILQILLGWPATILLLVASYVYGTWRLKKLGGPSVEEFKNDAPPPWEGQQRGF
ncbi:MAG TPA: DUF3159 domain-containing protein [Chloroflexi bacterium]|nr:DUF3159 domain-containing protein [Chloroflexota bacterium]